MLFGRTIEVVFSENHFVERPEASGFASYRNGEIQINPNPAVYGKPDQREETFCHELVHFLTFHAGSSLREKDHAMMHTDEEFVDLLGNLLHQALSTMEYD